MYEYNYVREHGAEMRRQAAAEHLVLEALGGRSESQVRRWLPLEVGAAIVMVGLGVSIRLLGLGLS
jgi:hypothetical protein